MLRVCVTLKKKLEGCSDASRFAEDLETIINSVELCKERGL